MSFFKKKNQGVPDVGQEDAYDQEQQGGGFAGLKEDDMPQNEQAQSTQASSYSQQASSSSMMSGGFSANEEQPYSSSSLSDSSSDKHSPGLSSSDNSSFIQSFSSSSGEASYSGTPSSATPSPATNMNSFTPKTSSEQIRAPSFNSGKINMEFEKINAKFDYIMGWIKQFYERFGQSLESLGALRNMAIANEKSIGLASMQSAKAIELVKEVQPERLRIDIKKTNMRIDMTLEKMEMNKEAMGAVSEEIKDLKRRAEVFIGTEELLKLNDEIKKDMVEIQKVEERVRVNADKTEQIFIELKKGLAEIERLDADFGSFRDASAELRRELGKIQIKSNYLDQIKKASERSEDLIQRTAVLAKTNREAIGNFRFEDYQEKMDTILKVMETLADQVSRVTGKSVLINPDELGPRPVEKPAVAERSIAKKIAKSKKEKKRKYTEDLEDVGDIPELPELEPKPRKFRR